MKKIILVMAVMACFGVASEIKPVYTDKEIHDMAFSYKTMMNRPDDFKIADHIGLIFQSSEFFGYIAGMMDTHETLKECAKTHSPKDIAYRTSLLVESLDIKDSGSSAITMFVSVKMACDNENWKRK